MRARKFKGAGYPVEERRHLLSEGTVWTCGVGQPRRVLLRDATEHVVLIAFLAPGRTVPPRVVSLTVDSFLRNYRREDEGE